MTKHIKRKTYQKLFFPPNKPAKDPSQRNHFSHYFIEV